MFVKKTAYCFACLFLLCLFYFPTILFAQRISKKSLKLVNKAQTAYYNSEYQIAKELAIQAVEADSLNLDAYLLLSDLSAETNDKILKRKSLEKIIELAPNSYVSAYKMLANLFFDNGEYQKVLKLVGDYSLLSNNSDSVFVKTMIEKAEWALQLINNPNNANIVHLGEQINTFQNEYWPFVSADDSTLYFTRLITNEQRFHFERLFYAKRATNDWLPAQKLSFGDANEVNEGTMSLSADGRMFFFTACGKRNGFGSCDIYYMLKQNGLWQAPVNAGKVVNTSSWEAQPSVSANGEFLFWSSNREGGLGEKDIWYAPIIGIENGIIEFGTPVNPGRAINTRYDDFSPFIHADNQTLYFASTGHYGLGGSDLFISRYKNNTWQLARNMGFPINSRFNDDGLVISPNARVAVFSSDREGAFVQSKDLYMLELPNEFMPSDIAYVKGVVIDKKSKEKLDAKIEITNIENEQKQQLVADATDGYIAVLQNGCRYAFHVSQPSYLFCSEHFDNKSSNDLNAATIYNIELQAIEIGKAIVLNNIFFDHDVFDLKAESKVELDKLVDFLKLNPTLKVEISGHTDNTGSVLYNLKLSENRAQAIADFLKKSISDERIAYVGYGQQYPVADNSTEQGRSRNRRSELKIISY